MITDCRLIFKNRSTGPYAEVEQKSLTDGEAVAEACKAERRQQPVSV